MVTDDEKRAEFKSAVDLIRANTDVLTDTDPVKYPIAAQHLINAIESALWKARRMVLP